MKMNWIYNNIGEMLGNTLQEILDFCHDWLITFLDSEVEMMSTSEITAALMVTTSIGVALVVLMCFKQIWSIYVMKTDDNPDADPMQVAVKGAMALALIGANTFIFNTLQSLSRSFAKDLVGSVSAATFTTKASALLNSLVFGATFTASINVIVLIISVVMLIGLGIKMVEQMLMKILYPIMAVDKISRGSERFNDFFSKYIVTFLGYALQMYYTRMALNRIIAGIVAGGMFRNYLAGIVWFWLALKTPKWLKEYSSIFRKRVCGTPCCMGSEKEGSGRLKQILVIVLCLLIFALSIYYNYEQEKSIQPQRLTEMIGFTDAEED